MKSISVHLPSGTVPLEYIEIVGLHPGPTVTITAGMDGDEYIGIETARTLSKRYTPKTIHGRIYILPLINAAGFASRTSYSPIDAKYPKLVFPGSENGTHTELFMHWLYTTHIKTSDIWIDLHGGSKDEELNPFIWVYQSKVAAIRTLQQKLLDTSRAPIIVYDRYPIMNHSVFLDNHRVTHIVMECGDKGNTDPKSIAMLSRWIDDGLQAIGVLPSISHKHTKPDIYTSVTYVRAPFDGFWQPESHPKRILGTLTSADLKKQISVDIIDSQLLWRYIGPFCYKWDILAAYAKR